MFLTSSKLESREENYRFMVILWDPQDDQQVKNQGDSSFPTDDNTVILNKLNSNRQRTNWHLKALYSCFYLFVLFFFIIIIYYYFGAIRSSRVILVYIGCNVLSR